MCSISTRRYSHARHAPISPLSFRGAGHRSRACPRSAVRLPKSAKADLGAPPAVTIFNPSYLKNAGGFGIKVVSDFLDNDDRTVPRMSALVVLFCGRTGVPRTVMEGAYLTDVRTGAGTALAARHLARADSAS